MSKQKIGFIGLGLMGAAMVDRLMSKGLKIFDQSGDFEPLVFTLTAM